MSSLSSIEISTWYWLTLGVVLILLEIFLPGMMLLGALIFLGISGTVSAARAPHVIVAEPDTPPAARSR